ncbi:MAG: hypothetical protein Q8Q15_02455 [bacterium]|nr:hypothetical protein [bacterium]
MKNRESDWSSIIDPGEMLEAINNLTRINFHQQQTSPELIKSNIRWLKEIGYISKEEATKLFVKIDKLAGRKKRA